MSVNTVDPVGGYASSGTDSRESKSNQVLIEIKKMSNVKCTQGDWRRVQKFQFGGKVNSIESISLELDAIEIEHGGRQSRARWEGEKVGQKSGQKMRKWPNTRDEAGEKSQNEKINPVG